MKKLLFILISSVFIFGFKPIKSHSKKKLQTHFSFLNQRNFGGFDPSICVPAQKLDSSIFIQYSKLLISRENIKDSHNIYMTKKAYLFRSCDEGVFFKNDKKYKLHGKNFCRIYIKNEADKNFFIRDILEYIHYPLMNFIVINPSKWNKDYEIIITKMNEDTDSILCKKLGYSNIRRIHRNMEEYMRKEFLDMGCSIIEI